MIRETSGKNRELVCSLDDFKNLGFQFVANGLFGPKFKSVAVDPVAGPLSVANKPIISAATVKS